MESLLRMLLPEKEPVPPPAVVAPVIPGVPVAPRMPPQPAAEPEQRAPASERRVITLGQAQVSYELKRSERRRRVGLLVDDRGLIVMAPGRSSDRHIDKVLQQSAGWIQKKLAHWQASAPPARQWRSGERVDFLGGQLLLDVLPGAGRPLALLQDGGCLQIQVPDPADGAAVRQALVHWYKRHALSHLPARVEHYARELRLRKLPRFVLSGAATRWGSCNASREIRLNWRLMQAPAGVIDYVAAHEVAHILEMNHSPRFWQIVERLCPDHAGPRAELDAMTRHYMNW